MSVLCDLHAGEGLWDEESKFLQRIVLWRVLLCKILFLQIKGSSTSNIENHSDVIYTLCARTMWLVCCTFVLNGGGLCPGYASNAT